MKNKMVFATVFALQFSGSVFSEDQWEFTVSPYFWIAGQSGDVATLPNTEPAEIDISIGDILDNLDMTFMGLFEARKGKVAFFSEVFYIDIQTDDVATPGNAYSDVDYEQQLTALSLGASYRWSQDNITVDLLGGVRYWEVDNELSLDGGLLPAQTIGRTEDWVDPIVGVRLAVRLNNKWSANGWMFSSIAGDSDSAVDIYAGTNYKLSESLSLSGGYRHQTVDYSNNGFVYDVEISGPTLGLSYTF